MSAWVERWAARSTIAGTPRDAGLFLALAPMDGVTDAVFRALLCGLFGGHSGISLCVSEFIRVTDRPPPAAVFLRHCPELARGGMTAAGVPVFVQLLGGAPAPMAKAARTAVELGALGIDLNFGCPARKVNNHDGGAALLRYPDRLRSIVAAVRDAVPLEIPVSAKIRVGWADDRDLEEIVASTAAGGASWITIHARTRVQGYKPPVHWRALARAQGSIEVPVVANGDLFSVEDLVACAGQSGCDAFMIGRGAMSAPGLFARARGARGEVLSLGDFIDLWRTYYSRLLAAGASEKRALSRVKQWLRFAGQQSGSIAVLFERFKIVREWCRAEALFDEAMRNASN